MWLTACPVESEQPGTEINYYQGHRRNFKTKNVFPYRLWKLRFFFAFLG
jgi:hypothetical protein